MCVCVHTHVCVRMLLYPPSLPFFWTCKGSAHLRHSPKPVVNAIYRRHHAPTSSFPRKAPSSHSPWDSRKCDTLPLLQRAKWLLLKLTPTLSPCGLADGKGCEQPGPHASSPLPHPPLRVQVRPLWSSLSSSHRLVQQEPRRFLSPDLLHGQRTALPAKPPGRPITKLYTVPCALSL